MSVEPRKSVVYLVYLKLPFSQRNNEFFQSWWLIRCLLLFCRARKTPDHSAVPEIVDGQVDGAERYIRQTDHIRDSERRAWSDLNDQDDDDDECRRVYHGRLFKRRCVVISGERFTVDGSGNGSRESER